MPELVVPEFDVNAASGSGEAIGNSALDWGKIDLLPANTEDLPLQDAELFPHYGHARRTDAALVRVQREEEQLAAYEKFLFYRGVGNFEMPVEITVDSHESIAVTNKGDDKIRSVFALRVSESDGASPTLEWSFEPSIDPRKSTSLSKFEPITLEDLCTKVSAALDAEGLYHKESEAMVACWKDAWFREPGVRVFYMVPQRLTDAVLPLHIEPEPTSTVRVLVARSELMSPSMERNVVRELMNERELRLRIAQENASIRVSNGIRVLGRLAEPMLVRASQITRDSGIREEADLWITELRRESGVGN